MAGIRKAAKTLKSIISPGESSLRVERRREIREAFNAIRETGDSKHDSYPSYGEIALGMKSNEGAHQYSHAVATGSLAEASVPADNVVVNISDHQASTPAAISAQGRIAEIDQRPMAPIISILDYEQ